MIKNKWLQGPIYTLGICLIFFLSFASLKAQELDGAKLYRSNCSSCHAIEDRLTGPPLKGARDRAPKEDGWIYKWVKNSQKVIQSGDAYAVALYKEYNETKMQAFPTLSNEEIDAILDYADNYTPPVKVAAETAVAQEAQSDPSDYSLVIWVFLITLIAGIIVLARITIFQNKELEAEKGEEIEFGSFSYKSILKDKRVMVPVGIIVFCFVASSVWDFQTALGRQQGYAPEQPIHFSHKIHAGINKIPCQYCHSGARTGKSAVIPSLNVCMNCHKAVDEYDDGPLWNGANGTDEIHKIYKAIGWDSERRRFDESAKTKPVEWVRIHNLPDHVYFNHAQHVTAGKVECQTCHGPVEEMDVLQQHAPLSMGWCVNCHRETEVQFDNPYYEHYEQIHEELSSGKRKGVTVGDIGGTECQKCHY